MVQFHHYKKQQLEKFTTELVYLNELYGRRSFDLDKSLLKLLAETQEFFRQMGLSTKEVEVSQLRIFFETAQKGINPLTLEKVSLRRRENVWTAAYHCLHNLGNILANYLEEIEQKLADAQEDLGQIILSAYQSNILNDQILGEITNFKGIAHLWNEMKNNVQINLLDKKLKLSIQAQDIHILLDKIITNILK